MDNKEILTLLNNDVSYARELLVSEFNYSEAEASKSIRDYTLIDVIDFKYMINNLNLIFKQQVLIKVMKVLDVHPLVLLFRFYSIFKGSNYYLGHNFNDLEFYNPEFIFDEIYKKDFFREEDGLYQDSGLTFAPVLKGEEWNKCTYHAYYFFNKNGLLDKYGRIREDLFHCNEDLYFYLEKIFTLLHSDLDSLKELLGLSVEKVITVKTYIIKNPINGLYKIGKSQNLKTRYNNLCSQSGIELIKILSINSDVEIELHLKFKSKRKIGEWFELSKNDLLIINNQYETIIGKEGFNA